jgi:6-phosphogluconolactonase (cycloisomerase 2 family)/enamine deaminase RidA (YjgF/YER057c/UK114 family)
MIATLLISLNTFFISHQVDTSYELIIGSYTKKDNPGIEVFDFKPNNANATRSYTIQCRNASYLSVSPDGKHLYAVSENVSDNATVSSFVIGKNNHFELTGSEKTLGAHPCFILFREASKTIYTANYTGGSISVFKTQQGNLMPISQQIKYVGSSINKRRQASSHAHQVVLSPDQNYLYVNDLGTDQIHMHKIYADGTLDEKSTSIKIDPGSGPRHMVFNRTGDMAYLLNELKSRVDVFKATGEKFELIQNIDADNVKGDNASADIHISPDGKWLLTSNRITSNEITVFNILSDGRLKKIYHQPVAKTPRNFSFDPSGKFVLVASQDEDRIQVFSFDAQTGMLTDTKKDILVTSPVCIQFRKKVTEVDPEERIKALGINLIKPSAPIANYVKYVQTENLIFLSGHGPDKPGGGVVTGKLGADLVVEDGQAAARLTGISLLSTLKMAIGDLNRVKRIVKVLGLVNSASDFTQQPAVMNGFSNLMVDVFGDRGRHARSAVGVNALPNNFAVEIEMIVELKD